MAHIDYYFSPISPYTYLAGTRMEAVAEKHGATITYKPLDIIALFGRTGGTAPKDRHPARQEYRAQAFIAASKTGEGDLGALVASMTRACWAEDKDVAEDAEIKECLVEVGFDPALADSGLLAGAEAYSQNLEEAANAGAFGAPFYILDDGARFWGQDRIDDLDMHLAGRL